MAEMTESELMRRLNDIKDSKTIDEVVEKTDDLIDERWG